MFMKNNEIMIIPETNTLLPIMLLEGVTGFLLIPHKISIQRSNLKKKLGINNWYIKKISEE